MSRKLNEPQPVTTGPTGEEIPISPKSEFPPFSSPPVKGAYINRDGLINRVIEGNE